MGAGFTSNNVLVSICQLSISITVGYESAGKTGVSFIGPLDSPNTKEKGDTAELPGKSVLAEGWGQETGL